MKLLLLILILFQNVILAQGINSKDINQWQGNDGFWTVEDGVIIGKAGKKVLKNEFLWSKKEVKDIYLGKIKVFKTKNLLCSKNGCIETALSH